jgi:glycosyltransferase involved in cell wall biosynthesis
MVIGVTRIRNESEIISNTLDHMATFCDKVIVYDDCSTDNTVDICNNHHIVDPCIYKSC